METMVVPEGLHCMMMTAVMPLMTAMMPLLMHLVQGVLFGMPLLNSQETQVVCHKAHPCFEGHTMVAIVLETMAAPEDMLCLMTVMMPLMMHFIQGILFGMHLVNSQETQVVCC
jgi:hypothetical protein